MPDWSSLAIFITASLILLVTPGPAVLYIVARSVDQGRSAGIVSAVGVGVGSLCHVAAAVLGLSALLASSALAFAAVKYLGAAYLVYLGVRKFLQKDDRPEQVAVAKRQSLSRIFTQGVIVNLLNPKVALFFFAFLPQFVSPARGAVAGQILFLGLLFVAMAICSDSLYALLAGTAGRFLRHNLGFLRAQRYFAGSVYIALGVATAASGADGGK